MKNKLKAMSLVEVLCVVAIMALVATGAHLGYQGVQRVKAERQLHMIQAELNDLKMRAMSLRETTSMKFSASDYQIFYDGKVQDTIKYEDKLQFLEANTANNVRELSFSSSGRPSNSGTISFSIENQHYRLILSPVNGILRLEKDNGKKGL